MKTTILILVTLFNASAAIAANENQSCQKATAILNKFINLEKNGETLHNSKLVDELVDYGDRDSSGWDSFYVILSSQIKECRFDKNNISIDVTYQVLGDSLSNKIKSEQIDKLKNTQPKSHKVVYQMVSIKDNWKLDSRSIETPHILLEVAKKMDKK